MKFAFAFAPISTHVSRTATDLRCATCGMRRMFRTEITDADHETFAREHGSCARNGSELQKRLGRIVPIACEACGRSECSSVNEPGTPHCDSGLKGAA